MVNRDLDDTLIRALLNPACYPHPVDSVSLLETHISWVLLAGDFAYKIKKPVDFGFLNFTDLDKRGFFCREELRLNRPLAADLYLDVIEIGGSADQPIFGLEPIIEYAVKMRRFAERDLLDHLLQQDGLTSHNLHDLAATLARCHAQLPVATVAGHYGHAAAIAEPARQNFQQLSSLLGNSHSERLHHLQAASEQEFQRCLPLFAQRLKFGWVRECHGDLHLGNIVLLNGRPTPFDSIEFNPDLRWIDVMNDIAFLVMDLLQRQRTDLAYDFLNAYLEINGDYAGLGVLRFYLGYRAVVMAKVAAIRAAQLGEPSDLAPCLRYLALAERLYATQHPVLFITHGLPGCGKTTVSQILLEKYQAIRLRSDIERKRLHQLSIEQSSESPFKGGIYTAEATQYTYRHLLETARSILQCGFSVIVDAAFLRHHERQLFCQTAKEMDVPFLIIDIQAKPELHRQRIRQRMKDNLDASEADVSVYETLKKNREDLTPAERVQAIKITNNSSLEALLSEQSVWQALDRAVNSFYPTS